MFDSLSKPRPPKGYTYVLKTSQLARALSDAGVECHVILNYWIPQGGGSILEGRYWLPNQNTEYPRVYVRAGGVPADWRIAASEALLTTGLPEFVHWLKDLLTLPDNSTSWGDSTYFNATYTEAGLNITYQPIHKIRGR